MRTWYCCYKSRAKHTGLFSCSQLVTIALAVILALRRGLRLHCGAAMNLQSCDE